MNIGVWCRLWLLLTPLTVGIYFGTRNPVWLVVSTVSLECFLFEVARSATEYIVRRLRSEA